MSDQKGNHFAGSSRWIKFLYLPSFLLAILSGVFWVSSSIVLSGSNVLSALGGATSVMSAVLALFYGISAEKDAREEKAKSDILIAELGERASAAELETEKLRADNLNLQSLILPRRLSQEKINILHRRLSLKLKSVNLASVADLEAQLFLRDFQIYLPQMKVQVTRIPVPQNLMFNAMLPGVFLFETGLNGHALSEAFSEAEIPYTLLTENNLGMDINQDCIFVANKPERINVVMANPYPKSKE